MRMRKLLCHFSIFQYGIFTVLFNTDLSHFYLSHFLNLLYMSATIGAAAVTAGAGLLGSLFGANKQDKNARLNVIGRRKCILWIEIIILL